MIIHLMQNNLNGVAPLAHLGVIRAQGADAAKFLHGQLTQDFSQLDLSEARLAAFCSAKGRMQASFIGFKRSPTEILLICSRDILAATLKRLSMFVLRAQVKLSDASADYALFGLMGAAIQVLDASEKPAWSKTDSGNATLIFLYPADGVQRALWLAPIGESAPAAVTLNANNWAWAEVRSGVAMITAPIVDAFVPQMLNYESVGGVSFKKGCYPGQEVVARSQFRGTLKRRTCLAHGEGLEGLEPRPSPGQEVFLAGDAADQPSGVVVQAAVSPAGGVDLLAVVQVTASAAGTVLHLGAPDGPALVVQPLPYPLLADI